jgi:hypothetical protein
LIFLSWGLPHLAQKARIASGVFVYDRLATMKNDRFPKTIEVSKNFHGTKMAQKFSEPLILQGVFDRLLTLIT